MKCTLRCVLPPMFLVWSLYACCAFIKPHASLLLQLTDQYNLKWRWDWIIADFWCGRHVVCWLVLSHTAAEIRTELKVAGRSRRHIQNLFFLSIICFLFRPSFNSTRYAYSELEGTPPSRPSWAMHPAWKGCN